MSDPYLPFSIVLAIASGIVYGAVGYQVGRRPTAPKEHLAMRMFQAWWWGLAGLSVFTPLVAILSLYGLDTLDLMLILVQVLLLVIFAAIAGLVYYLLYLYTGKRAVMWVVIPYFGAMIVWLQYILLAADISGWGVPSEGGPKTFLNEDGGRLETDPVQGLAFGLLVGVPPLLSAIAFFLLYFKADLAEQKYRIAMVAGALILWFGSSLVGTITGLSNDPDTQQSWRLANGLVGLFASIAVYVAYKPPEWIRRRLNIPAAADDAPGA